MELVAFKQGFHGGARIRVGQAFHFDENAEVQGRDPKTGKLLVDKDGAPVMVKVRMPSWAAPKAKAQVEIAKAKAKEEASAGDTKPVAAQRASKAKAQASTDLA